MHLSVFVVEVNAEIREGLAGALEELTCVKVAGTSATEDEALAWLEQNIDRWELVIVDLFLKQGSGLGVIEACRQREAGQHLVVLSNYATADMRDRCKVLGADAVFDKSNEIDALVDYCLALGEAPRRQEPGP